MIRWRCFARTLVLLGLLGTALTASAASIALGLGLFPDPSGEIARVAAWGVGIVLGFLAVVGGAVQLIVRPIIDAQNATNREWLKEAIGQIDLGVRAAIDAHATAQNPHAEASAHMHEPLRKADEELLREIRIIGKRLSKLTHAHNMAMQMERTVAVCTAPPAREPHRASDPPGADFSMRPAIPSLDALTVPDAEEDDDDAR